MRNSVDELFVEGTCNVFGVDVCVVLECYGVLVFLLWSHGLSMCSLQIFVLFVLMRVEISLFNSGILGSCGLFLLVKFMCAI